MHPVGGNLFFFCKIEIIHICPDAPPLHRRDLEITDTVTLLFFTLVSQRCWQHQEQLQHLQTILTHGKKPPTPSANAVWWRADCTPNARSIDGSGTLLTGNHLPVPAYQFLLLKSVWGSPCRLVPAHLPCLHAEWCAGQSQHDVSGSASSMVQPSGGRAVSRGQW